MILVLLVCNEPLVCEEPGTGAVVVFKTVTLELSSGGSSPFLLELFSEMLTSGMLSVSSSGVSPGDIFADEKSANEI